MRKTKKEQLRTKPKTVNRKTQRILIKTTIKNLKPINRHQYINKGNAKTLEPHYQSETPKDLLKTLKRDH
jgi:hypothetical protein